MKQIKSKLKALKRKVKLWNHPYIPNPFYSPSLAFCHNSDFKPFMGIGKRLKEDRQYKDLGGFDYDYLSVKVNQASDFIKELQDKIIFARNYSNTFDVLVKYKVDGYESWMKRANSDYKSCWEYLFIGIPPWFQDGYVSPIEQRRLDDLRINAEIRDKKLSGNMIDLRYLHNANQGKPLTYKVKPKGMLIKKD